jgi:hypothetical protein
MDRSERSSRSVADGSEPLFDGETQLLKFVGEQCGEFSRAGDGPGCLRLDRRCRVGAALVLLICEEQHRSQPAILSLNNATASLRIPPLYRSRGQMRDQRRQTISERRLVTTRERPRVRPAGAILRGPEHQLTAHDPIMPLPWQGTSVGRAPLVIPFMR